MAAVNDNCNSSIKEEQKSSTEYIRTLQSYRDLTLHPEYHSVLLQDKTVLLLIATLIESENEEIVDLCIAILENFAAEERNHEAILNMFGLFEGLSCLSMSKRNESILERATALLDILRSSMMGYSLKTKTLRPRIPKKYLLYNIYLPELTEETRIMYEKELVAITGVISFVINVSERSCFVRVKKCVSIKSVVRQIRDMTETNPLVVVKNRSGKQEYINLCESRETSKNNLHYDEVSHIGEGALNFFTKNMPTSTRNIFNSVKEFLNESFYW